MHCMAHGRSRDHRPSRGSRNAAAVEKLGRSETAAGNTNKAREFAVPDLVQFETPKSSKSSSIPRNKHRSHKHYYDGGDDGGDRGIGGGRGDCYEDEDGLESVGSCPTPPPHHPELEKPRASSNALSEPRHPSPRHSPRRSPRRGGAPPGRDYNWEPPSIQLSGRRSPLRRSPLPRCGDSFPAVELLDKFNSAANGEGCRVSGRSSSGGKKNSASVSDLKAATATSAATAKESPHQKPKAQAGGGESKKAEDEEGDGDGGGCGSESSHELPFSVDIPLPAKWRCYGRRPPAILEYRPMGEPRTRNVRPAGKQSYLMRRSDEKRVCDSRVFEGDVWDDNYGLAKPVTDRWTTPLPYGETRVIRTGDIDPWFTPARGDLIVINPAQNYYRAMKSGYVMTLRDRYVFGIGDLVLRLGKFLANGTYVPYGNLELYLYTATKEWRFMGRQPYLQVDFNYHNLDYESPGKYLAIGTFLTDSFKPRRGDIIVRGGAWEENYHHKHRRFHSSVRYWRPNMDFLPNDMLLRPYVDMGRCEKTKAFYWGAAELYSYSGKGLAWAYWGRDHHVCDTPFPGTDSEPIKTGHHKDETGHYGSDNFEHRGA